MKKYRALTREEAKALFEFGAPVESRHKYLGNTDITSEWQDWEETSIPRLSRTNHHLDEFRIEVE